MALTPEKIAEFDRVSGLQTPQGVSPGKRRADELRSMAGVAKNEIPGVGGLTPNVQSHNREMLSNVIKSFPGQELGKSIGTAIYGLGQQFQGNTEEAGQAVTDINQNMGKTLGDVANVVATPASFAVSPGTSIGKNALTYGALGAVQGGGRSLAVGNDLHQAAKDAFKSGLISGGIAAAATGVTNAIDKYANKSPEHIYNNALKVQQRIKNAGKSPSKFLSDNNVWGDLGSIKKASTDGIEAESKAIASKIDGVPGGMGYDDVVQSAIDKLKKSGMGDLYSDAQLKSLVEKVPLNKLSGQTEHILENVPGASLNEVMQGLVPWKDVNQARSSLGSLIGDRGWLSTAPAENVKAAKAVYGALADAVKEASGTTNEFAKLSNWLNTQKIVDRTIDLADGKYGIGLRDLIGTGVGSLAGFSQGGSVGDRLKNSLIGGAAGFGAERLATSPSVQTGIAQVLQNAAPHVQEYGRAIKGALETLVGNSVKPSPDNQDYNQRY